MSKHFRNSRECCRVVVSTLAVTIFHVEFVNLRTRRQKTHQRACLHQQTRCVTVATDERTGLYWTTYQLEEQFGHGQFLCDEPLLNLGLMVVFTGPVSGGVVASKINTTIVVQRQTGKKLNYYNSACCWVNTSGLRNLCRQSVQKSHARLDTLSTNHTQNPNVS